MDPRWMAVARGDEPADLVLAGGRVLSVFTKEWLEVDVAIADGHVVGLGKYDGRERTVRSRASHRKKQALGANAAMAAFDPCTNPLRGIAAAGEL